MSRDIFALFHGSPSTAWDHERTAFDVTVLGPTEGSLVKAYRADVDERNNRVTYRNVAGEVAGTMFGLTDDETLVLRRKHRT